MTKILAAGLLVIAFIYATYLVYLRRPLPAFAKSSILKRRFMLAAMIFAGFWGGLLAADKKEITCYKPMPPKTETPKFSSLENFLRSVKTAWAALEPNKADEFNETLKQAVASKLFSEATAEYLKLAYAEISHHKDTKKSAATCYDMTRLGSALYDSNNNLEKQLDTISKAAANKTLTPEAATTARDAIARELEVLKFLKNTSEDMLDTKDIKTTQESKEAAKIIVELQK